jgi:hypothetical protein
MIERVNPTLLNYEHIPRLVNVLQRVRDGELKRVLIMEPPRYFKTEVVGRLFPAYLLDTIPMAKVGLTSYGAELAWATSEEAREYYQTLGNPLKRQTSAKRRWRTMMNGELWAAGATGPITGFGYNYGIVDDPQDPEKAWSLTYQRRFEEWWPRKWLSRQEPDAAIIINMQRLGPNDAVDFLLRREVGEDTDEAPEGWHIVLMDEIRSGERVGRWSGPLGLPPSCTLEEDPRPIGAVLSPSRFSRPQVDAIQRSAGIYTTATQRQQRPSVPEGDFWKAEWFRDMVYDELPADAYNLGWDWDLAYSKEERNSASAGIRSARGPGKPDTCLVYIEDAVWDWLEFPEMVDFIRAREGPHYIEGKASGKSAEQTLQREGISVKTISVAKDKLARASSIQTVVANKRIRVKRSILRILLQGDRQGLLNVRAEDLAMSKGDLDLNDAFVQSLIRHVGKHRGKRVRAAVPGLPLPASSPEVPVQANGNGHGSGNGNGKRKITSHSFLPLAVSGA